MNNQEHHMPKSGLIAAILSAVGAALFFLWQPIMDYFVTGTYDDNIVIQIEAETIQTTSSQTLLDIQLKALNKGNMPVKLISDGKGDLTIEVRQIVKPVDGAWLNPMEFPIVAKKTLAEASQGDISVAPGSYLSRELAISLPKGAYWIEGTLRRKDDERISDSTYFQLGKSALDKN
jgi:hypothetical protein